MSLVIQAKQYLTRLIRPILPSWLPVTSLPYEDCVTESRVAEEFNRDPLRHHGWIHMGTLSALLDAIDVSNIPIASTQTIILWRLSRFEFTIIREKGVCCCELNNCLHIMLVHLPDLIKKITLLYILLDSSLSCLR